MNVMEKFWLIHSYFYMLINITLEVIVMEKKKLSVKTDKEKGLDVKCEVSLSVRFWKDYKVSKCV